jgi:hypothetical protein
MNNTFEHNQLQLQLASGWLARTFKNNSDVLYYLREIVYDDINKDAKEFVNKNINYKLKNLDIESLELFPYYPKYDITIENLYRSLFNTKYWSIVSAWFTAEHKKELSNIFAV